MESRGAREQKSVLANWYQRASVRSKPRRVLGQELACGSLFCFPPELAPFARHPLMASSGPEVLREGLMQQLFSYLHFTDRLEHEVVNRVVRKIAVGFPGLSVPDETRMDAYKIYCDEAYHSLFSADLMFQIGQAANFHFDGGAGHPALDYFHSQVEGADDQARHWFELFFVVVSETLISNSLLRIPHAPNVIPAVREMVDDHAQDELRHHAFFARLCRVAWPQVPPLIQARIARALPQFITSFLTPDYPALIAFLERHFSPREARLIIEESYPPGQLLADAQSAGHATLQVFRHAGAFEEPDAGAVLTDQGFQWNNASAAG